MRFRFGCGLRATLVDRLANMPIVKSSLFTCGVSVCPPLLFLALPHPLPRLTQVRWSRYGPEYRDPHIDKEYYRKPLAELTEEEKYDRELRKTQHIKAAPAMKTSSVFEDPLIRLDGNKHFCSAGTIPGRTYSEDSVIQPWKAKHVAFLLEVNSPI